MIILVGMGLTYILYNAFYAWADKIKLFDRKPFNCHFCLSFWVALIFFFSTEQYPALLIPLCYEIIRKLMQKL